LDEQVIGLSRFTDHTQLSVLVKQPLQRRALSFQIIGYQDVH